MQDRPKSPFSTGSLNEQSVIFFTNRLTSPTPSLYLRFDFKVVEKDNKEKIKLYRQLSLIGIIPAMMAVGPLIGFFIGKWLDGKFGTEPYLMWVLILLGMVAAGKEVYNIVKRISE